MKYNSTEKYNGSWPVLVTPFNEDRTIDTGAYRQLLEWYLNFNNGGIYANCLTGEMYYLNEEERLYLINEAVKTVGHKFPVAATGNLGDTLEEHIAFCRKVADAGADIVMLVVPIFHDNDVDLERYYLTMAEKVDAPLGIYECPVPRSYHLGLELVQKLASTGRFFAYKETACVLSRIKDLVPITNNTPLSLLQANIPYLLESIRIGAPGSMNIAAVWLPDLVARVIELGRVGAPEADRLHNILCAMELAQRAVHPQGVKYLLSKRGVAIKTHVRLSQQPLAEEVFYSLDHAAATWFRADGSLAVLPPQDL